MKLISVVLLSFLFNYLNLFAYAQEKPEAGLNADEILARVDKVFGYPKSRLRGKMVHVTPDGKSRMITIWGAASGEGLLLKFSSTGRDDELKVLYNPKGENIWVYDLHANKVFNKRGTDMFDALMMTNFTFVDLSHASLQHSYTATIKGEAVTKGIDCYLLVLEPVVKAGVYGKLEVFVAKKDFIPLRIDYHDSEKIIFKTMSIVKTATQNGRIIPIRYDMYDIKKKTATIVEFFEFNESIKFERKLFRHENLREN